MRRKPSLTWRSNDQLHPSHQYREMAAKGANIVKAWGLEFWAISGSIASFIAIVVLLIVFDGKNVFTWNNITLNAIISILSLAMKSTLAYLVAECLAQWKWIVFARQARPLMDFDRIDAATRGPLGSLRILTRTKGA